MCQGRRRIADYGAKATFFITGNNLGKGQIDIEDNGWPALLRRMHADGHQIAAHSWSHQNFSALNETEMVNQVQYLEMAFRNVLGFFPTYMRPPYLECRSECQTLLNKMGYHTVYQSVIDFDWLNDDKTLIQYTKNNFTQAMNRTNPLDVNYIFLEHDTHYQTCWNLTNYMLDYFKLLNFSNSVTVGECMGDPPENWYRTAGGAANHSLLLHKSHSSTLQYSTLLFIFGQIIANMYMLYS